MGAAATVVSRVSIGVSGSAAVDERDVVIPRRVESDGVKDSAGAKKARMPMQVTRIDAEVVE